MLGLAWAWRLGRSLKKLGLTDHQTHSCLGLHACLSQKSLVWQPNSYIIGLNVRLSLEDVEFGRSPYLLKFELNTWLSLGKLSLTDDQTYTQLGSVIG